MDSTKLSFLEATLKQRQHALWAAVVKNFEISEDLRIKVQQWINAGTIESRAYDAARKRRC